MPLTNIHTFVDDEVITADDLNSIGNAVSSELASGNIPSSSLVWPFVAQGDIDMNGYSISGIASFFGAYHVNSSQSLAVAVAAVNSAGGGTIIIDDHSSATATDLLITAPNVSIIGSSGASAITVGSGATLYGIKVEASNFRLQGLKIGGGVSGIPCINIHNTWRAIIMGNHFDTCQGPCISFTGPGGSTYNELVTNNVFSNCAEQGILVGQMLHCTISDNGFRSMTGHCIELSSVDACLSLSIEGNNFVSGTGCGIYGPYAGAGTTSRAELAILGNTFYTSATYDLELGTYFNCTFLGNVVHGDCVLKLYDSAVTGNGFYGACEVSTTRGLFANNKFRGAVTNTAGIGNVFNGNHFTTALAIDASWIDSFVGNYVVLGVTVTTTDPDVVGLNWGY